MQRLQVVSSYFNTSFLWQCFLVSFVVFASSAFSHSYSERESLNEAKSFDDNERLEVVSVGGCSYYGYAMVSTDEAIISRLGDHIENIYNRDKFYLYHRYGNFVRANFIKNIKDALHAYILFEDAAGKNIVGWAEMYGCGEDAQVVELALAVDPIHRGKGLGSFFIDFYLKQVFGAVLRPVAPIKKYRCLIDKSNVYGRLLMTAALRRFGGICRSIDGDLEYTFSCTL